MEPKDVIRNLASSEHLFAFDGNVVLEHYSYADSWIQYGTASMREMFGQGIHYEFKTHYTKLFVYLHDERGRRDALREKLHEIARWHGLENGGSIVFCCPGKIRDLEDEAVIPMAERALRELVNVFEPFFDHVHKGLDEDRSNLDSLVASYRVENDIMSATDFIRRVVAEDHVLDLGEGIFMSPSSRWKCYDGWDGWRIYKGYLADDNVHFEVRVKDSEISVELHDERGQHDALHRILYREAVRNCLPIDVNDAGLWIGQNECVPCSRRFDAILVDVSRSMRFIWNVYGGLLEDVLQEGTVLRKSAEMPPLTPMPSRDYAAEVKSRREIPCDTLCWVTNVADLVERAPISLSCAEMDQVKMCPGRYVIPSYQRKYAWTSENVSQLCRDLLRAAQTGKGSYHLGTLIFHAPRSIGHDGTFFVVDGQQRLRTISRLLSVQIFSECDEQAPEKQFTSKDEENIWKAFQRFRADKDKILSMLRKSTFVCIAVGDITESFQLFSTQNGRGKTLSPENLLKAYHFHEIREAEKKSPEGLDELDSEWERLNRTAIKGDGLLLHQVIGEHLYRIRCWLRGDFPRDPFSAKKVSAFKGLTVYSTGSGKNVLPLGNLSTLRRCGNDSDPMLARRTRSDRMNPFVFIDQPIVNGSDFFKYVATYCRAHEMLFGTKEQRDPELGPFYAFYATYCLYPRCGRRGDEYARHIYQSLCLYCFDRFGASGLNGSYEYLYCCAYYERAVNARCYYQTCGGEFTRSAVQTMADASNLEELVERLGELHLTVRERFGERGAASVEGLECVHAAFSGEEW